MAIPHSTAFAAALALFCLHDAAYADVQSGVDAWRGGDYAHAVSEWQPLSEAGDPDAQFNMGQAYKLGRGVPQDMSRARDLFGLAAAQGHQEAEANIGLILFQEGNREQAMPYIIRAAEAGEPRAQYIYGTALFNGDLAPRDWPRAYALMTNASEAGIPQASESLQQMDTHIPIEQREQGSAMATQMTAASQTTPIGISPPLTPTAAPVVAAVPAVTPIASPSSTFTLVDVPPPVETSPVEAPPLETPPASPPLIGPPVSTMPVQTTAAEPVAPTPEPSAAAVNAPSSPAGTTTAAPAAAPGDWRIQLGAFRERPRAEALWRRLASQSSTLAALQPYLVRAGPHTRLQAGPFETRSEAQRACRAAVQAGSECITVHRR